jgi:uncharacterized protein (DUF58 family)
MTPAANTHPADLQPAGDAIRPRHRRATLGWSGFLFVFITVFLAIGAVNSQNNLLFWVFGLAVAAVIVSGIISGNSLMGLRHAAHDIPDTPVGVTRDLSHTLVSRNRLLPVFALNIRELDAADTRPGCALHIAPRSITRATIPWTPTRRGPIDFDRVLVESRFPFGFIVKSLEYSIPRRALVTPPLLELDPRLISALGEGQTEHRIKRARRNATGAYFGLRPYAPGDPRRLIAWRPSARRSDLLVVEHAEPQGRSFWIHLTAPPPSSLSPGPFDYLAERAIALAASLAQAGSRSGRPVGVWAPWAGVKLSPATGAPAESRAVRALAMIDGAAPFGPDSEPPVRPGDSVITIPLVAANSGVASDELLDPARPEDWLARGAALPPSLLPPAPSPRPRR